MNAPAKPPLPLPPHQQQPVPAGFVERLDGFGVQVSEQVLEQLGDYLGRLLAANAVINLISRTDPANGWDRHIFDSLTLLPQLAEESRGARLLDVGSGGGLPGIPIAIARPDLSVTLLDATQKKVRFLATVSEAMGLQNVSTHAGRAEHLPQEVRARGFDVVTARAVKALAGLVMFTAPLLKPGGRLLLIKGQKAEQELATAAPQLKQLHLSLSAVVPTPSGRIVVLQKPR